MFPRRWWKLVQLLETVEQMKKERVLKICWTQNLHKNLKLILGTAEEDTQQIKKVDELYLRAVGTIQQGFGIVVKIKTFNDIGLKTL